MRPNERSAFLNSADWARCLPATAVGVVQDFLDDGLLDVATNPGESLRCEILEQLLEGGLALGDRVLVALTAPGVAVVVGRIARFRPPQPEAHLKLEASETLTLQCGESTLTLHADGKVLIKGEDIVLRAKGTQRIRAGTVAIN